jgi:F0F1-type ATP synthase epsilon subunit
MNLIDFTITTPQSSITYHVEWIEVESPSGTFFVGFDHAPLISMVKQHGSIVYKEPNCPAVELVSRQGTFFVKQNQATLITDDQPISPSLSKNPTRKHFSGETTKVN